MRLKAVHESAITRQKDGGFEMRLTGEQLAHGPYISSPRNSSAWEPM
ncbi:hypothetical protein [Bifidobacterium margollesii]|nr:hypothetical protein [Bifidobacterium margollesii]